MKYTIEQLSYIVPAISIGFLAIITSINLYFKIRKHFSVTVNCWFCNENSRVPYVDFNKWTCGKCEQYNGFTTDGDYNCDIPAQRSSKLNKWKNRSVSSMNGSIISSRSVPTNGLCQPCNRNQELKVQQLASFEPQHDAYFDEEIEEYRAKLEQAYRLCPRCKRCLKRTLNRVKTNVLGSKLKQIGAKGLRAFDLSGNDKANQKTVYKKRYLFARITLVALISISLLQLFVISNQMDITKAKLDTVFSASTTASILTVLSYVLAAKIMIADFLSNSLNLPYISFAVASTQLLIKYLYTFVSGNIWTLIDISVFDLIEMSDADQSTNIEFPALMLNLSGCFMSTFLLFLTGLKIGPVLSLVLWSCNMILPSVAHELPTLEYALIFDLMQLSFTWSLTTLSLVNVYTIDNNEDPSDKLNSSFHRIDSEYNSDASESETESELDTSLRSNSSAGGSHWNKTQLLNSTIACSSPSIASNASLLHQLPFAASTQSLCSLRPTSNKNTAFGAVRDFKMTNQMDLTRDKFNSNQSAFVTSSHALSHQRQLMASKSQFPPYAETDINSRCMSRNSLYDVPDDFESGITQLSISGIGDRHINYRKQTRIFGSSDRIRDSLQKSVLAPSRLNANDHHHANQSSWLAGGYWNNSISPQKRCISQMSNCRTEQSMATKAFEVFPMISRTSSHSSGFESMRNSTSNNSRENSLCDEMERDRTFLFCEPAAQPLLIKPQPKRSTVNPTFSAVNGMNSLTIENSDPSAGFRSIASSPSAQSQKLAHNSTWNQFSHPSDTPSLFSHCTKGSNHTSMNSLGNLFNKEPSVPPYQRGSLIKLNTITDN